MSAARHALSWIVAVWLTLVTMASGAIAVQPDEVLPDKQLEERARHISTGLRCLVCQNQSIDDSDAPLARDLRLLVRERLKAGDSDDQVVSFIVDRYGDFVLLKPPFKASTLLLWLVPLFALSGGAWLAYSSLVARRSPAAAAVAPKLSAEEERRLGELLKKQASDQR